MATLTTLPTELLQEIFSQLSWQDLISCLYQNSKLFCIVAPFIWKDLGDGHWGYIEKTPWRWKIIKRTLLSDFDDDLEEFDINDDDNGDVGADEFSEANCSNKLGLNIASSSSSYSSSYSLVLGTPFFEQNSRNDASVKPIATATIPTDAKRIYKKRRPILNYAQYIQRIDVSSAFDADFRIDKSLMGYLFANCKNLVEISLEYHKESLLDEPFLTLKDLHLYVDDFENNTTSDVTHHHQSNPTANKILAPVRRLIMKLYDVSPEPLISLLSSHFTSLQEISLQVIFEQKPIPMEDLRKLVKNNTEFKKLMLYTIQGQRTFVGNVLDEFKNGGELPEVERWWIPDLV